MKRKKSKYLQELAASARRRKRLTKRGQGVVNMVTRIESFVKREVAEKLTAAWNALAPGQSFADFTGGLLAASLEAIRIAQEKENQALVQPATDAEAATILGSYRGKRTR